LLFPGIKKIARKLDLYSSGSIAFGSYRQFQIKVFDGNNKKVLLMKIAESPGEDELMQLKKKFRIRKIIFDAKSTLLEVEFRELFKPYKAEKIISLINEIIDLCEKKGISSIRKCDNCENSEVDYYRYGDQPMVLCPICHNVKTSEVDAFAVEFREQENRYLRGISGALIFSIPGIFIQGLLFILLKSMAALSSVVYCFLALKGYVVFKGKPTPLASVFIIIISLFMTVFGTVITYCGYLYTQIHRFDMIIPLLQNSDVFDELVLNVTLQVIISSFYLVFEFFSLKKRWTFMKILPALRFF